MDTELLKRTYAEVLSAITSADFIADGKDRYSGVFLPYPFEEYKTAGKRVMVVGRETAFWNTKNGKNTIGRIVEHNRQSSPELLVDEAFERYSWHLLDGKGGRLKTKHTSHFKRFYSKVASTLSQHPASLVYANLFAWDYAGRTPANRNKAEFEVIQGHSVALLAKAIEFCQPELIIFATGCNHAVDSTIKRLMNGYFNGYETTELVKKRYWRFCSSGMDCVRIAHPRASSKEHREYRERVLEHIVPA